LRPWALVYTAAVGCEAERVDFDLGGVDGEEEVVQALHLLGSLRAIIHDSANEH